MQRITAALATVDTIVVETTVPMILTKMQILIVSYEDNLLFLIAHPLFNSLKIKVSQ